MRIFLIFSMMFITICCREYQQHNVKQYIVDIPDVTRIFMHSHSHISFFTKKPYSKKIKHIHVYTNLRDSVEYIADVPKGNLNRIKIFTGRSAKENQRSFYNVSKVEVHIHKEEDVDGSGWDHGKHGVGRVNVVE